MPRSAKALPWRASWSTLLALPATIQHRSFGSVWLLITAPRAHGVRTSQGKERISFGSTALALNFCTTCSTVSVLRSVTIRRALLVEQPAQVVPDVPEALYRHRPAFWRGCAKDLLDAGSHPLQDAQSREGGGITRAAVRHISAHDVRGLNPDVVDVPGRNAYVLGHDVAPAQSLNVTPERTKEGFGLVLVRVADNDGLPAAEIEAAGGFVGHTAGEAQGVDHGLVFGRVGPHPAAAQGRPKGGVVDRDDCL